MKKGWKKSGVIVGLMLLSAVVGSGSAAYGKSENILASLIKEAGAEGDMTEAEKAALDDMTGCREKFIEAMDDDLNTADAISAIFELVTLANTAVKDGHGSRAFAESALERLQELADVLGLLQKEVKEEIDPEIQKLIDERQEARKAKNFARADEIRDLLKAQGITLKDTPQGVQIVRE